MSDALLERVITRIWKKLTDAPTVKDHPWRIGVVATAEPGARVIVVRAADREAGTIDFFTDVRSEKITRLREDPGLEWLFWEPRVREQVRLHCTATVHHDDDVAGAAWADLPPMRWREYSTVAPPGAPVTSRADGHARVEVEAAAKANFALVRCAVAHIDWMQLGPAAEHTRARFERDDAGVWAGQYVVP